MSYILLKDCIGKDRGWKVNMFTIEKWGKGIDPDAFNSTSTYAAVHAGLLANCKVKEEEPDFTYEQVCDYVDALNESGEGVNILEEINKVFESSQYFVRLVEKLKLDLRTLKGDIDDDKKKELPMM